MKKSFFLNRRDDGVRTVGRLLSFFCMLIGIYACQVDEESVPNKGMLNVRMEVDTTLVNLSTKASVLDELADFADVNSYGVTIAQDSGVVAQYSRFDKMPEEVALKEGKYTVSVSKGKESVAAFNSPYFFGKEDFTIVKEMTTPVTVTASLANSRVTVDFSDDFLAAYTDYTLSFKTEKMDLPLVYGKDEFRPMYFQSDAAGTKLTIAMELVNVYGKTVNYTATTTIKPKQGAQLTVRTDGKGVNGIAVDVTLNDQTKETVYVNIGIPDFMEKLKGAPFITCDLFKWDDTNVSTEEPTEYAKNTSPAEVKIMAGGKIKQILLTLKDEEETLIDQYDLANLTEVQSKDLSGNYGFSITEEIKGKMQADFNLQPLIAALTGKLKDSYYELSLTVIDDLPNPNKTTKTVKISVPAAEETTVDWGEFPIDKEFEEGTLNLNGIADATVGIKVPGGIKDIAISIDGTDVKDQNIFKLNVSGIVVSESSTNSVKMRFSVADWFNKLSSDGDGNLKQYRVSYKIVDKLGRTKDASASFTITRPVFEWAMAENDGDIFAKYAYLRVKATNADKVIFYQDGKQISSDQLVPLGRNEKGIVSFVWKGLTSNSEYQNIIAKYDGKYELNPIAFTTEEVGVLPNAGFEEWNSNKLTEGGTNLANDKFVYWNKWYPWGNSSSEGWNTVNQTTTQYGAKPLSIGAFPISPYVGCCYTTTSGTKPTDDKYQGSYAALIRTVGWGKENTATANLFGGMGTCKIITAGELYLGTYDVSTHSPSYTGYVLSSRPYAISFAYKYLPKNNNDWGTVDIDIKDEAGNSLMQIQEKLDLKSTYMKKTIPLNYLRFSKAKTICIGFKSSGNPGCLTISSDNLTPPPAWDLSDGEYVGSQLYIDDVELIYDYPEN